MATTTECVVCGVADCRVAKRPSPRGFAVGALCGVCIFGEVIRPLVAWNSHPFASAPECLLPLHRLIAVHNGPFENGGGGMLQRVPAAEPPASDQQP